ncbi:MAG: hypothetical protein AAF665_19820 [Pseudomonadota bacterium]
MFNSTFKSATLCMLSAALVATTVSISPTLAGEGGDGDRKSSWTIEPDVKGLRELVEKEMRKSERLFFEVGATLPVQTDAENEVQRNSQRDKSQSSER